jgi:photosystem II stability/assembly factor-like uncharacterized protein
MGGQSDIEGATAMASHKKTTLAIDGRPHKDESTEASGESTSTHKVRSTWFQARESWPWRESPIDLLTSERARVAAEVPPAAGVATWEEVGPSDIGGRMTSAVCHPTSPDRIWAGAAGGGVWHSPDAGKSWQALTDDQPSLNIGALALDVQDPDIIYCGTGEANLSADSHPGVGVFRSLNAGQSWQLLAAANTAGLPRRIGALAVDPFNSSHLLAAGVSHQPGEATGLFVSTDGGTTWARVPIIGTSVFRCHDVHFHPTTRNIIYVTISALGVKNGIWRSADGGISWQQLGGGLPSPDQIGRTSLALAPSDPDVLYAQMSTVGRPSLELGVFRSADGGDTWQSIGGQHFAEERQMSYGNAIVVHPTDPDHVLCGGVDLHRTTDAGRRWTKVTKWDADRGAADYAHADHHALVMPAAQPGIVYDFNDGGMDFSSDGGTTWENRSNGLATNMFYDLEVAQANGQVIAGGAQDNGTLITSDARPDTWFELTGGDGGWIVIDRTDVNHLYSTAQGMRIFRHRSSDGWKVVSPPETEEIKKNTWMVFMSMDSRNPRRLFTGSVRVWRTRDDGNTWQAVSDVLDGSPISALEVARADSDRIYVGTENGSIYRSTDAGANWSGNLASSTLPGVTITRLESRPDDADVLYATVANFGNSHVFRSADGGLNWVDIDNGQLGDAPLHSIAVPVAHPTRVYACGDLGVFVSDDEGATWANLTANLPPVIVVDLVYQETDHTLTAATYGRSVWRLQVD